MEKQSYAERVLLQIAEEVKRSPSEFRPYIEKLEQNWYDTKESMADLTEQQLTDLGFPKMLINKILSKIAAEKSKPLSQNSTKMVLENNKPPANTTSNAGVVVGSKNQLIQKELIKDLLIETKTTTQFQETAKILHTLLNNIVQEPKNPKFHSIKLDNPKINQSITPFKSAVNILFYANFKMTGEKLLTFSIIDYEEGKTRTIAKELYASLNQEQNVPKFNPYQESISSYGQPLVKDLAEKTGTTVSRYVDMLEELKQKRLNMIKPVSRDVTFLKPVSVPNPALLYKRMEEDERVEETDSMLLKQEIIKTIKDLEKSENFSSKRKKEFEDLMKKPVYLKAVIRFKFPNGILVQVVFTPLERMKEAYEELDKILLPNTNYYLYVTPPKTNLTRTQKETFEELCMVPQSIIYVGIENYKGGELFKDEKKLHLFEISMNGQ